MTQYSKTKDKVMLSCDSPLWIRDIEVEIPEKKGPEFTWKGGKISFKLWRQITAFMLWSQQTFKSEAMGSLYYNKPTGEWAFEPPFQLTEGLSVTTNATKRTENDAIRAKYGKGWLEFGSVHHHCAISAFSSGTDDRDEDQREGLHITLGDLDEAILDIHGRMILGTEKYETVDFSSWFDLSEVMDAHFEAKGLPNTLESLNVNIRTFLTHATLTTTEGISEVEFPDEWKERVSKRPPVAYLGYQGTTAWRNLDYDDDFGVSYTPARRSTTTSANQSYTEVSPKTDKDCEVGFTFFDSTTQNYVDIMDVMFDPQDSRPYRMVPSHFPQGIETRRYLRAAKTIRYIGVDDEYEDDEDDEDDEEELEEELEESESDSKLHGVAPLEERARDIAMKGESKYPLSFIAESLASAVGLKTKIISYLNNNKKKEKAAQQAVEHFLSRRERLTIKNKPFLVRFMIRLCFIYEQDRASRWEVEKILDVLKIVVKQQITKTNRNMFMTRPTYVNIVRGLMILLPKDKFVLSLKILESAQSLTLSEILLVAKQSKELTEVMSECYIQRRACFFLPIE